MAFPHSLLFWLLAPRAGTSLCARRHALSACRCKSGGITEKGFSGGSEKSDSIMVNRLFRFHQHLDSQLEKKWHAGCTSFAVTKRSRIRNRVFGNFVMLISLLEEVASFAAIFLFVTALAFWSNILSTI
jgi:hypothetical protein